jgi:hypothetical protein
LAKKKILMIGKKSYSNTAVVFVFLGFYFFLVFFENFLNKQPTAVVLLRYIIYVVVAYLVDVTSKEFDCKKF